MLWLVLGARREATSSVITIGHVASPRGVGEVPERRCHRHGLPAAGRGGHIHQNLHLAPKSLGSTTVGIGEHSASCWSFPERVPPDALPSIWPEAVDRHGLLRAAPGSGVRSCFLPRAAFGARPGTLPVLERSEQTPTSCDAPVDVPAGGSSAAVAGAAAIVGVVGADRAGAVGVHGAAGSKEVSELAAATLDA